jgi:hypothetical protein
MAVSGIYKSHNGEVIKVIGVGAKENGERYVIFHPVGHVKKFFVEEVQSFLSTFMIDGKEYTKFIKLSKEEVKRKVKNYIQEEAVSLDLLS